MKEEDIIRKYDTQKNPFHTPDGYFEGFTGRLMQRMQQEGLLDQQVHAAQEPGSGTPHKAEVVTMSPVKRVLRYAAAAVVAGVCVAAGTYLFTQRSTPEQMLAVEAAEMNISDETLYEALDYEMEYGLVNNNQIAYYLTEAY